MTALGSRNIGEIMIMHHYFIKVVITEREASTSVLHLYRIKTRKKRLIADPITKIYARSQMQTYIHTEIRIVIHSYNSNEFMRLPYSTNTCI